MSKPNKPPKRASVLGQCACVPLCHHSRLSRGRAASESVVIHIHIFFSSSFCFVVFGEESLR